MGAFFFHNRLLKSVFVMVDSSADKYITCVTSCPHFDCLKFSSCVSCEKFFLSLGTEGSVFIRFLNHRERRNCYPVGGKSMQSVVMVQEQG